MDYIPILCRYFGTIPKGYPKRQKFFERQKHLENSNQSNVEARNRVL